VFPRRQYYKKEIIMGVMGYSVGIPGKTYNYFAKSRSVISFGKAILEVVVA